MIFFPAVAKRLIGWLIQYWYTMHVAMTDWQSFRKQVNHFHYVRAQSSEQQDHNMSLSLVMKEHKTKTWHLWICLKYILVKENCIFKY